MERGNINILCITYEEPEAQECQITFLNTVCVCACVCALNKVTE